MAALRKRPSHAAEQTSQLLLGEPFEVVTGGGGKEWIRIRCEADGYVGWVRSWHLAFLSGRDTDRWRQAPAWRVAHLLCTVHAEPGRSADPVLPLPWAAVLLADRRPTRPGWIPVRLPDGRRGFVRRAEVVPRDTPPIPATPARLERTARRFLGVPYEWGGRSSWGMDCSGFVQTVLGWHGIRMPRDAWQQARSLGLEARPGSVSVKLLPPGKLAFFGPRRGRPTHVGLVGVGGNLLHALGQVRADSLVRPADVTIRQLVTRFMGVTPPIPE